MTACVTRKSENFFSSVTLKCSAFHLICKSVSLLRAQPAESQQIRVLSALLLFLFFALWTNNDVTAATDGWSRDGQTKFDETLPSPPVSAGRARLCGDGGGAPCSRQRRHSFFMQCDTRADRSRDRQPPFMPVGGVRRTARSALAEFQLLS